MLGGCSTGGANLYHSMRLAQHCHCCVVAVRLDGRRTLLLLLYCCWWWLCPPTHLQDVALLPCTIALCHIQGVQDLCAHQSRKSSSEEP